MEITDKFAELFSEFESNDESEQKQKIKEMNALIGTMEINDFYSSFTIKRFDKINEMIEKNKLSLENAITFLRHMGYVRELKSILFIRFEDSSLGERFEKIIIEEEKKKEEKNEKLFADLCECYLLLSSSAPSELHLICMSCLLKVALKKEENKETQKEVEFALLALSCTGFGEIKKEIYLNEMKEIILHHQKHHNLTHPAFQSAWQFLMNRLSIDRNLEVMIVNDLHFRKEAPKELEELTECIDWKRKAWKKEEKVEKEVIFFVKWLKTLKSFLDSCRFVNEEYIGLIRSLIQVLHVAKANYLCIYDECIRCIICSARNKVVKVDYLLKGGAIDALMKETIETNASNPRNIFWMSVFENCCGKLKEKMEKKEYDIKRIEIKRKILEVMEEEGYEDCIFGFCHCFRRANKNDIPLVDDPDVYNIYY